MVGIEGGSWGTHENRTKPGPSRSRCLYRLPSRIPLSCASHQKSQPCCPEPSAPALSPRIFMPSEDRLNSGLYSKAWCLRLSHPRSHPQQAAKNHLPRLELDLHGTPCYFPTSVPKLCHKCSGRYTTLVYAKPA